MQTSMPIIPEGKTLKGTRSMLDPLKINRSLKEETELFLEGQIYLYLTKKILSSCLNYEKQLCNYFVFVCDIWIKLL